MKLNLCAPKLFHLQHLCISESHILFTNSRKWKVKSERADIDLRTSVLTLLLESLCQEFAEKAFFIFDLILGEQTSNFWPVGKCLFF